MTLEQAWKIVRVVTAPPSPTVLRVKRAWSDLRATAGIVNEILPEAPKEEDATTKA